MDPAPLVSALLSFLSLYLSVILYRKLFPYEKMKEAMERASEYRALSSHARDKRAERRLRAIEPEYRRARSLFFRGLLFKFFVITILYVIVATASLLIRPVIEVPFYLPLLTSYSEGTIYMPILYINFFSFIYGMLLFRDSLL